MIHNPIHRKKFHSCSFLISNIAGKIHSIKTNLFNYFEEIFEYQYSSIKFNKYFFLLNPKV